MFRTRMIWLSENGKIDMVMELAYYFQTLRLKKVMKKVY